MDKLSQHLSVPKEIWERVTQHLLEHSAISADLGKAELALPQNNNYNISEKDAPDQEEKVKVK